MRPAFPNVLHKWYYAGATIHALLGVTAELLGLYIVIVAGTSALPHNDEWMIGIEELVRAAPILELLARG